MAERARRGGRWAVVVVLALACGHASGEPPEGIENVEPGFATGPQERQGSGGRNADRHLEAPYVVMVSFDGFRHDYLDVVETPAFDRVVGRGARAVSLIPVFPTKTFPNHYTLATGMYPARHGLVDNIFWDPERGERYSMRDREAVEDGTWYGGEPIWVTAETQGMVSAAYFWVGTEADVSGVRPTRWHRYDSSVPNEARVDSVLAWLRLPARERPHLILLYFSDTDWQGHEHGPESPQVREAVRTVDRALGRLLDGLDRLPHGDEVHLVLVSDHGMAEGDPEKTYVLSEHADLSAVQVELGGPYATLFFAGDTARAARVRQALGAALPRASVLHADETPERWRYRDNPRVGDLLVVAELPWLVGMDASARGRATGGHHGWDPAHERMHGIFIASGPRIREGVLVPSVEAIHVYPLVTHLLGLEPNPDADGRLTELKSILR